MSFSKDALDLAERLGILDKIRDNVLATSNAARRQAVAEAERAEAEAEAAKEQTRLLKKNASVTGLSDFVVRKPNGGSSDN